MQNAIKPVPKKKIKENAMAAFALLAIRMSGKAVKCSVRMESGEPKFAMIALALGRELKRAQRSNGSSVDRKVKRLMGNSGSLAKEWSLAMWDGVLTTKEVNRVLRKTIIANGGRLGRR